MNGTLVTAQPTSLNNTLLWNPHFVLVILIWPLGGDCLDSRNQAHRASYLGIWDIRLCLRVFGTTGASFRDNRGNRGKPGQTGPYFRGKPGQTGASRKSSQGLVVSRIST